MADEGEFPKIDGDILYASEINRIRPKVFGFIDQNMYLGSATNYTIAGGSIFYSGTYPSIFCSHINVQTDVHDGQGPGADWIGRFRFSGTEFNEITTNKSPYSDAQDVNRSMMHNYVLTSGTFAGWGGTFGSPFVIFFETQSNNTLSKVGNLTAIGV